MPQWNQGHLGRENSCWFSPEQWQVTVQHSTQSGLQGKMCIPAMEWDKSETTMSPATTLQNVKTFRLCPCMETAACFLIGRSWEVRLGCQHHAVLDQASCSQGWPSWTDHLQDSAGEGQTHTYILISSSLISPCLVSSHFLSIQMHEQRHLSHKESLH